jgi:hypothetical protein
MEDTIVVSWYVNISNGSECLTLDYLDCKTMEEWNDLDKEEQRERIKNALYQLPEINSIIVDDWS